MHAVRLLWWGALVIVGVVLVAGGASPSPYVGSTMTWDRIDDDTVRYEIMTVWDMASLGVHPGDEGRILDPPSGIFRQTIFDLDTLDPEWMSAKDLGWEMHVAWVDVDDGVFGAFLGKDGDRWIERSYPFGYTDPVSGVSQEYEAFRLVFEFRKDTSEGLMNNAATRGYLHTYFALPGSGQPGVVTPPQVRHPGVTHCRAETICTMKLDIDATTAWRLTVPSYGHAFTPQAPPGPPNSNPIVAFDDRTLVWDTRGIPLAAGPTFYSVLVDAQIGKPGYVPYTHTQVDLLIKIDPAPESWADSVAIVEPTPCGRHLIGAAGATFSVDIEAEAENMSPTLSVSSGWLDNANGAGTVRWDILPVGRQTVVVQASNDDSSDLCLFDLEGITLDATMDHVDWLFRDATQWHDGFADRSWRWETSLGPALGPSVELAPGDQQLCLTVSGTVGDNTVEDTICDFITVGSTDTNADDDHDGVANDADNCPSAANRDQLDGDADGIGDACDHDFQPGAEPQPCLEGFNACPANGTATICSGADGVPDSCDKDADGDRVDDRFDNCPSMPNPSQDDADGNGVGDVCDAQPSASAPPRQVNVARPSGEPRDASFPAWAFAVVSFGVFSAALILAARR